MFISLVLENSGLLLLKLFEFFLKILLNFIFLRKVKEKRNLDVHLRTILRLILIFYQVKVYKRHKLILRKICVFNQIMFSLSNFNGVILNHQFFHFSLFCINCTSGVLFYQGLEHNFNRILCPWAHINQVVPQLNISLTFKSGGNEFTIWGNVHRLYISLQENFADRFSRKNVEYREAFIGSSYEDKLIVIREKGLFDRCFKLEMSSTFEFFDIPNFDRAIFENDQK